MIFTYDPLSRLTQADTGPTVAQPASTITYSYDKNGNRISMTDPQTGVTSYVYDALNRLSSLASPQGSMTFSYDTLGRRTSLTLPNGATASYTYDAASQLTELLNTIGTITISRFAYTYDAVGNRITRTTTNGISNYDYHDLNRLFNATQPDPVDPLQQLTETFQYDPVGNRTSSHLATGQVYDGANRLLEDSNFTFSYDANGNLTEKIDKTNGNRTVFSYNVENQLVQVEKFTVAGGVSPVLAATYSYDALDRRIEKSVNGVVTRYIYDNEDILLELDSNNQVIARYTHGFGVDESLIMLRGGQSFFYHTDGLGSIWDLTDNAGTPVLSYTYDSFGQLVAQTGTLSNPYTYSGREFDPETGLYYYRARHYMPSTARFIQTDLLFGLNRYSYVGNNPINFTDPTGLQRSPGFQPMDGGTDNTPGMPIFVLPPNASIGAFRDQIVKNFNWDVLNKFNADFNRERFFKELEIPFGEKRKAQVLCRIRRVPPNVIVEAIRILPEEDVILRTPIRGLEQIRSFFVVLEGLKIEVEPPRR